MTDSDENGQDDAAAPSPRHARFVQRAHRIGLIVSIVLILLTLLSLPFAASSMSGELFERQDEKLYGALDGKLVPDQPAVLDSPNQNYINLAIAAVDEVNGIATLAVSGNRICNAGCKTEEITFYALDDNASQRRGTPPTALLTLNPTDVMFSETVQLPIRGAPTLFPFDRYEIWLGFSATEKGDDGKRVELTSGEITAASLITLQNQDTQLVMHPPKPIDPASVRSPTDPYDFVSVQALEFRQPTYVIVLAVLLVVLISMSGIIAVTTKSYQDLALGIGSVVLGVWGVRSVLVTQPMPGSTLVDIALSFVIIAVLLAFVTRSAVYFEQGSGWKLRRRG